MRRMGSKKKKPVSPSLDESDAAPAETGKKTVNIEEEYKRLGSRPEGLTSDEAHEKLEQFGRNELPKKKTNFVLKYLMYFWSPLAWAMEIAAIVSICLVDYLDFILICVLLILNATIGFYEEFSSGKAVEALQKSLALNCKCMRDGVLEKQFPVEELVPGDIISIRLGDVVPADCYLLGDGEAKIDQSSLTGESLPSTKREGDICYSGTAVKQGEFRALVCATGAETSFGKTASLLNQAGNHESHINVVLRTVAWFCICFICIGVIVELSIQFGARSKRCSGVRECQTLGNALVLVVGGIPIAMPTVLSVMQALGAVELSKEGAIVLRLTAVEEIAGMEVLCSDKTGTLTLNRLTVDQPIVLVKDMDAPEVLWHAALAANKENTDAIDLAMFASLDEQQNAEYDKQEILKYHPFDPTDKWTWSKVRQPDGKVIHAAKGAPQIILGRSEVNGSAIKARVDSEIDNLAKRGFRAIGVATSDEEGKNWTMIGLIPLFDPPRHDTKATIERTLELGVGVKMITGDQLAIAVETAQILGMSGNIVPAEALKMSPKRLQQMYQHDRADLVEWADGFAQVLPEDKFDIVASLQADHSVIVGMTGDGVNDAPALKKADIGIAVADATDAARGAADIVLTQPGLSVIVSAILCSRVIFQRMKSYTMYSVTAAIRIVLTFTILTVVFDFYFPTVAVVFFAILNDGTMICLSKDRAEPSDEPEKWNLRSIFIVAVALGLYLATSTIIYFLLMNNSSFFSHFSLPDISNRPERMRGVIYLQVSLSGLSVVFSTRTSGWMWKSRPSWILIIAFVICQGIASVLGAYGLADYASESRAKGGVAFGGGRWGWVLATWIWAIIWFIPVDFIKRLFLFLAKMRIVRTKDYVCIPYSITFQSHQEAVIATQRRSFEEARRSRESVSIDMGGTTRKSITRPSMSSNHPVDDAMLRERIRMSIEYPERNEERNDSSSSVEEVVAGRAGKETNETEMEVQPPRKGGKKPTSKRTKKGKKETPTKEPAIYEHKDTPDSSSSSENEKDEPAEVAPPKSSSSSHSDHEEPAPVPAPESSSTSSESDKEESAPVPPPESSSSSESEGSPEEAPPQAPSESEKSSSKSSSSSSSSSEFSEESE